jgi:iron complex transport system substrate-binding protein
MYLSIFRKKLILIVLVIVNFFIVFTKDIDAGLRVVSLSPAVTEIVCVLGATANLVAISTDCNYPAVVSGLPKVGSFLKPNLESIFAINPDIVLGMGNSNSPENWKLNELGISTNVYETPESFIDIYSIIKEVGYVLGKQPEADALVLKLLDEVEAFKAVVSVKPVKVLFAIWGKPLVVAGKKTFINDMIETAGGQNIVDIDIVKYPKINPEYVVHKDPSIIIVGDKSAYECLKYDRSVMLTSAGREDRLFLANDLDVLLRPGPRFVEGIKWLEKVINKCRID